MLLQQSKCVITAEEVANILLNRLIGTNVANLVPHPVQSANEFLRVFILLHLERYKCLECFLCIGRDDLGMLLAVVISFVSFLRGDVA